MSTTARTYNQFCAMTKALDIIGERWTLLIVRELLSGPKRFKDLTDALPGIGANLLSARLKDMELHGLTQKTKLPPPAASVVYSLTERGAELNEVTNALVKWGFQLLGIPKPEEFFLPRWAMQALLVTFDPGKAKGVSETYEFHIDDEVFHIKVHDGKAEGALGVASQPDMVLVATAEDFLKLGFGKAPEKLAKQKGLIKAGSADMLRRFRQIFVKS